MRNIIKITGSQNSVRITCMDCVIRGESEFKAPFGKIDGFIVHTNTLKFEDGDLLTPDQLKQLKKLYKRYYGLGKEVIEWVE